MKDGEIGFSFCLMLILIVFTNYMAFKKFNSMEVRIKKLEQII